MKMKLKWCLIILAIAILWIYFQPGRVTNKNEITLKAVDVITLDLASTNKNTYSTFLTNIRDNVKDPNLKYGGTDIPVVRAPTNTYLRINLQLSAGNTISLAVKRNDLYVAAYMAKNNQNKFRAYYFQTLITPANLDKVFTEATGAANQQKITEYNENYGSVEVAAKMTRKEAGLGIAKLKTYMNGVHEKARNVQDEARFILVVAQMVAEATRFAYIENLVLDVFPSGFSPGDKVIIAERNWNRITTAIKASTKGVFTPPIVLEAPGISTTWTVSNADELSMGILLYLG